MDSPDERAADRDLKTNIGPKTTTGPDGQHGVQRERPKTRNSTVGYYLLRFFLRILFRLLYRAESIHSENLPAGGAILVSNHSSFLDIPAVGTTIRRQIRFVGRDTLDRVPVLGAIIRNTGTLYIRRGTADISALREIAEVSKNGGLVLMFPEGTRTFDGQLQELRPGVLVALRRAEVPLIPVGIIGVFDIWSRNRKFPRLRGKIVVSFGKPIVMSEDPEVTMSAVRDAILCEIEKAADQYEAKTGRAYPHRRRPL